MQESLDYNQDLLLEKLRLRGLRWPLFLLAVTTRPGILALSDSTTDRVLLKVVAVRIKRGTGGLLESSS